MLNLSKQFHDRVIKKTYFAIVNGLPLEERSISVKEALELGVDIDPNDKRGGWQLIDSKQDGRQAVTVWRAVRYAKSLRAKDGYLTLVELKPKTGRYHQLRRHMAWECKCPLVGDSE
jgi:23S rRNA-/tRNA-specific pseudouridylate synthase